MMRKGAVYREEALAYAQTAYFVGIVVMQWADVVISKTRRQSVFRHGFRYGPPCFNVTYIVQIGMLT